jgi:hypothetical protein
MLRFNVQFPEALYRFITLLFVSRVDFRLHYINSVTKYTQVNPFADRVLLSLNYNATLQGFKYGTKKCANSLDKQNTSMLSGKDYRYLEGIYRKRDARRQKNP